VLASDRLGVAGNDVVAPAGEDLVVAGGVTLATLHVVVRVGIRNREGARPDRLGVARDRVVAVARVDRVVAGLVVVVLRPRLAGVVVLVGLGIVAGHRLRAAGDDVMAVASLDGVVARPVAVVALGVVVAGRLGNLVGDRLGVARDLVPEPAIDIDEV